MRTETKSEVIDFGQWRLHLEKRPGRSDDLKRAGLSAWQIRIEMYLGRKIINLGVYRDGGRTRDEARAVARRISDVDIFDHMRERREILTHNLQAISAELTDVSRAINSVFSAEDEAANEITSSTPPTKRPKASA